MKSYETRHWTEVCSGSCPGCFFFSAKRAIGVHGRGGCDAPLTARLGAVGRRKILPKILKAKHDSVSKKTVTQWECHWLSYNNTYFITSQNFAICPKTFSDLLTVTINGMQEIHPVIHLLLKRSQMIGCRSVFPVHFSLPLFTLISIYVLLISTCTIV